MEQSAPHNRRRGKAILSCTFCRGRKLRCDRESPCGACARRGKPTECTYSSSEQERRNAIDYRPRTRGHQAHQRIARLEDIVTKMRDMAQSSRQPPGSSASINDAISGPASFLAPPDGQVIDDMGKLNLTDDQAVYTGSSHWVTVLEEIQHLKMELSEEYPHSTTSLESTPHDTPSPATKISLLNSAPRLPREQILAMMPPRKIVDRHVSHFFNAFDLGPFLLHRNKFLAEYANFWNNPSTAPIMWVGLLCSVMSTSAFLQKLEVEALSLSTVESQDLLDTYRTLTIHCLVAGDYLRSSRYTIETLILHFSVDQNADADISTDNWILIGVIIRIALRMGLHRDPSHWPDIRPYQAELRRRLWIMLYQLDFFTSTQVGLPRIIKDSQCDTRPPTHLLEHDLGFEHDEIPPERPLTESTSLLFIIQRDAIIKVAAEIYDSTEAGPPSPAASAALGAKLESVVEAIPEWLKYKPLESSIAENPATILSRMFLDVLVQKALYLLHRRSFVKGTVGEESMKSNELCIKASLAILEHQRRMNEEIQLGGLMFGNRWKVSTSLNYEFLQATMMLCFVLSRFNEENSATTNSSAVQRRDDILEALIGAKGLWEKDAGQSIDARKAAEAITTVLQHDLHKSSTPKWTTASEAFLDQMPGVATHNYFGSFDYEQDMALDPSLFAADNDMMTLGSTLDDFLTQESDTWPLDMSEEAKD